MRDEPDANPTYADLARHYGFAILPARPRRPRDKVKVEVGVHLAERWILAALRHRHFMSLADSLKTRRCSEKRMGFLPFAS